ncbi:MAG: cytidylate kinase family protein [Magnetococcales bacterium]|nr:cytidylate kinase family protein [Magnetococcales bacterium]
MSTQETQNTQMEPRPSGFRALAPVVMVAGPFGSGMEDLAHQLARHLKVPFYDPHKLETLARDRELHDSAWQHLRESVGSFFDYWLSHLHEKIGMSQSEHLAHLSATIRNVANHGGVIAGVCPHMILPGESLFRIQVRAGEDFCAQRLATLHGIDRLEALAVSRRLEEERLQLLHALFEEGSMDDIDYDLVLDAERASVEEMLDVCITALDQRGILANAA